MRWNFITIGLGTLLASSYLDNVRGVLLPLLSEQLHLSYSEVSWLMVIGSLAAVAMTILLLGLVEKISLKALVLAALGGLALSAVLSNVVSGFWTLLLFGLFLGLGIAACGALCNLLIFEGTDLHHRSRFLCGLHLMYGLGSFLAPTIAAFFLTQGSSWSLPFSVGALPAALLFILAALWLQSPPAAHHDEVRAPASKLESGAPWVILAFALYVPGEVMLSAWMSTFLVESRGFSVPAAAQVVTGFFLMMACTRAICFAALQPEHEKRIIVGCLVLAVGFFLLGISGFAWAFAGTGVMGPFFPLLLGRASRHFSKSSKKLSLAMLTGSNTALALGHFLIGGLTDRIGIALSYWLGPCLLVLSLVLLAKYFMVEKRADVAV